MTTIDRIVTPGQLAQVALADMDDGDSLIYFDANEPVPAARTKRVELADLRSFILAGPVVVGDDPDDGDSSILRVGGDSLLGGAVVVSDGLTVGDDVAVGGNLSAVNITASGTVTVGGIAYTFPGSQAAGRYLKTDGAGGLSWSVLSGVAFVDLVGVTITTPAAGQMLRYSGTGWVNSADGSALTTLSASALASGTVPSGRLTGAYTGVTGLGILTAALQFDDALYDIGSGGKRPRDIIASRNITAGGTLSLTGAATAASFSGDGSALTALSGTQVTTGTVAAARLAAHDLVSAHSVAGLTVGQTLRATGATAFAWAVLQFGDLGGKPTTLAGYGIADAYTQAAANATFSLLGHVHAAADITTGTLSITRGGTGVSNPTAGNLYLGAGASAMTALAPGAAAGYVRSDGTTWARVSGVAWADLTSVPTTLAGYGITDAYTKTQSDAAYAKADGSVAFTTVVISRAAGNGRTLRLATAGTARWDLTADSGSESGSNAGSDLLLTAYNDAGVAIDSPISITRASGSIAFARGLKAGTDATFDIGATGANRFRDLFLSRDATIGRNVAITGTLSAAGTTVTTLHATGAVTLDAPLTIANGGTGVASLTAGDLPYFATGTALSAVAIGTASKILRSTGTAPAWSTATFPNTATSGDLMVATGANAWGSLAIGANQRVLQSNGSTASWVANLDIGSGTMTAATFTGALVGNASTATLSATTTALANARTIGGVSFDGTANITVASATGGFAVTGGALTVTGHVIAGTDATYDVGASGATRFRDLFLSRNAVMGGTLTVTGTITGSAKLTLATSSSVANATSTFGYNSVQGTYVAPKAGSGADLTLYNDNGSTIFQMIGSGIVMAGAVTFGGSTLTGLVAGEIGLLNNVSIRARNAANNAYLQVIGLSSSHTVVIDAAGGGVNMGGALAVTGVVTAAGFAVNGAASHPTTTLGRLTSGGGAAYLAIGNGDAANNHAAFGGASNIMTVGAMSDANVFTEYARFAPAGLALNTLAISGVTTLATSAAVTMTNNDGPLTLNNTLSAASYRWVVAGQRGSATKWGLGMDSSDSFALLDSALTAANILVTNAGVVTIRSTATATQFFGKSDLASNSEPSAQVRAIGLTDPNKQVVMGINTTANIGFINATQFGTAQLPLSIQPGGASTSIGGHLLALTDATVDIGASGATRFRDLFLSRNAVFGGTINGQTISSAANFTGSVTVANVFTVTGSNNNQIVLRNLAASVVLCFANLGAFIGSGSNDEAVITSGSKINFIPNNGTTIAGKFDITATATQTALLIWDNDNAATERVTVGAADSAGAGFKVLRIPN